MKNPNPADFNLRKISIFKNLPDDEQELVRAFFKNKEDGYYVDVGANDPILESQTYHLEKLGWDGLLIEPLTNYCEALRAKRNGTVVQFACSAPENHNKSLKLLDAGVHSTLNEAPIAPGAESNLYVDVVCKTLDSILADNNVKENFDFISVDIEGHEMEMFKGFTLSKWKPSLVLLEDHVTNHEKHLFMIENEYQLIMRTGINSWYVPKKLGYKLSLFAVLQYFRKYYLGLYLRKLKHRR
ncbi:MAG: FkbM family methyltransferase [Methylococcaceae bacterium]|nr:FkbM family methyltransferase [Methylococcaceae bacterium]